MSDIDRGQVEQEAERAKEIEERLKQFRERWDRRFAWLWRRHKSTLPYLCGSVALLALLGITLNTIWLARSSYRHTEEKLAACLAEQKVKEIVASSGYPWT